MAPRKTPQSDDRHVEANTLLVVAATRSGPDRSTRAHVCPWCVPSLHHPSHRVQEAPLLPAASPSVNKQKQLNVRS